MIPCLKTYLFFLLYITISKNLIIIKIIRQWVKVLRVASLRLKCKPRYLGTKVKLTGCFLMPWQPVCKRESVKASFGLWLLWGVPQREGCLT